MIEDNELDAVFYDRLLTACKVQTFVVDHANSVAEAAAKMACSDYDVALLDLSLSDAVGLESFEKLRALDARLPIVMLTGLDDEKLALTAVESGAQDFIAKDHVSGKILYRVLRFAIARQLKVMGIQAAADTDPLTGLPNRRFLQTNYTDILKKAEEAGEAISLAILDLDHFKSINDEHGHFVGDAVLRQIAGVFTAELGDDIKAMRIGGEEFAVLMPGCDLDAACVQIDRLLKVLATTNTQLDDLTLAVTSSAGVIELEYSTTWDQAYVAADAALYEAKSKGRNRLQRRNLLDSLSN